MGIARHKLADHFRHAQKTVPLEAARVEPGDWDTPEAKIGRALQVEQVAEALGRMNPARAEAVALHLYVGLSLEETGEILCKSLQAVKKLVQRGLGTCSGSRMEPSLPSSLR